MKKLIFALVFLLIASVAFGGELLYEGFWKMYDMGPSALTSYKAAHIFASDDLRYSFGSASLNSADAMENFDYDQGTLEFWIRLNSNMTDVVPEQFLFSLYGTGGYIYLYRRTGANSDKFYLAHGGDLESLGTGSYAWTAGTWHHFIYVWDERFPIESSKYNILYIDGVEVDSGTTAGTALGKGGIVIYVGQLWNGNIKQIDALEWLHIRNRPLLSTEVTALYASGAGHADSFTVTPDTKLLMLTSDDSTSVVYHTFGKTVSAITAGGTEATLTTAAGSDTSLVDGDPITVSDGCGMALQAYVDGTPSSTSVLADDGAGAAVAGIDQVGKSLDFDGSEAVDCGNDASLNFNDVPFSFGGWFYPENTTSDNRPLVKTQTSADSYQFAFGLGSGKISFYLRDSGAHAVGWIYSSSTFVACRFYHIMVSVDQVGETAKLYVNGIEEASADISALEDISPTGNLYIGANEDTSYFDGQIAEVQVYNIALTAADILYLATHPNATEAEVITNTSCAAGNMVLYHNYRAGTLADQTAYSNDGTHSGTPSYDTSAFLSRNLIADGDMESALGGISDASIDTTITASKDTTTVHSGTRAQKILWTASNDATALELRNPTLVNGQDYFYRLWTHTPSIAADSTLDIDIDGAGSIVSREVGKALGDNGEFDRSFNLDATYYAAAANNTIHDVTTEDIGIWAWVKVNSDATGYGAIFDKYQPVGDYDGWQFAHDGDGKLIIYIRDSNLDTYYVLGTTDIRDDTYHLVAAIIDKDNAANCKVYIDEVDDTASRVGTLANVGSITSTAILGMGARVSGATNRLTGSIAEAGICYPADIMAAGEMGAAGEIAALYNNPSNPSAWPNKEDSWLCDDNAADTIVTGAVNNLTASANTNTFAEVHWKMFEGIFTADQDGAHVLSLAATGGGAGGNNGTLYTDNLEVLPVVAGDSLGATDRYTRFYDNKQIDVYADLDGDSQYFFRTDADFPESGITGATDMTIQAWIKPDSVSGFQTIAGKYFTAGRRMYAIRLDNDELSMLISSDGSGTNLSNSTTSGMNLQAGIWQHIAVVYDASAGTIDFYKNGAFVEQEVGVETSIADKDPNFTIGRLTDDYWYFNGGIASVALFDDKRTAGEILASAQNSRLDLSGEGNIIGQWLFNDAGAATAIDNSQGDSGRDLTPYDGGDVTYTNCGRTAEAKGHKESVIGADATETAAGDLYIRDDTRAAATATKSGHYPLNLWHVQ